MLPNAVEYIEMKFLAICMISVCCMWRILVSQSQDAVNLSGLTKVSYLCVKSHSKGGCLGLHITIQHYTGYP